MKRLFFFFGSVLFLSSCEDNMLPLSQDVDSPQLPLSKNYATRTMSAWSDFSVVPDGGLIGETDFSLNFSSSEGVLSDPNVDLYAMFYAPLSGVYPVKMTKVIQGRSVQASLSRKLQQVGTYHVEIAYAISNGSKISLTEKIPIIVTSAIDDYPSKKGWCVDWVRHKVSQMWGEPFYSGIGNATKWKEVLESKGFQFDLMPKVGDIAWWETTNATNGHLGHVAFVYQVIDENTVKISEYNYPSGKTFNRRTLYRNAKSRSQKFPHAFIHVQRMQ